MYISIINQWGNVARKLLKNVKRKTICRLDGGAGGKNPVGGESPTRIMDLSNPYNHSAVYFSTSSLNIRLDESV
jgi:hypothetical protein